MAATTFFLNNIMMIRIDVDLVELHKRGKRFKWNRPSCPNGCPKVWGHGFVSKCFAVFLAPLWLKRYRCPSCHIVLTLAPLGYLDRYQTSTSCIFDSLEHRLRRARWPAGMIRQRAGHWLRKLVRKVQMDFPDMDLLDGLLWFRGSGPGFLC